MKLITSYIHYYRYDKLISKNNKFQVANEEINNNPLRQTVHQNHF